MGEVKLHGKAPTCSACNWDMPGLKPWFVGDSSGKIVVLSSTNGNLVANRQKLRSNNVWSKFGGCEVMDETSNLTWLHFWPCPKSIVSCPHYQQCILFLGCQRLLKPTCVQPRNSRPKAPAPPSDEEPQTFKLGRWHHRVFESNCVTTKRSGHGN